MLLVWAPDPSSINVSNIKEKISYIWEAIDEFAIEVGKFQECLHIYIIVYNRLVTNSSDLNEVHYYLVLINY